jgi:hypothetical protein
MARKRAKAVKSKKPARPKDLALGARQSRGVKAGRTPSPAGPVPIPYPN